MSWQFIKEIFDEPRKGAKFNIINTINEQGYCKFIKENKNTTPRPSSLLAWQAADSLAWFVCVKWLRSRFAHMADAISDPNSTGITLYLYAHLPNALVSLAGVSLGFAIQSRMKKFNAFLFLKKQQKTPQQLI